MRRSSLTACLCALGALLPAAACAPQTVYGPEVSVGNGTVRTYVSTASERPSAVGLVLSEAALDGLPPVRNRTSRCWDLDGNGRINDHDECEGDYEFALAFPDDVPARGEIPFSWLGFNWNPEGHEPAAWSTPHFDFHFYMATPAEVKALRAGPCGFFMNCDDFERAIKPVPEKYVHPEHINVKAAVTRMGNHLIDSKTPELPDKPEAFTRTWIFGAYDGHITFYEPMITKAYLEFKPDECVPIKQPQAWERSGYYPTVYCIRWLPDAREWRVSLEGLVLRQGE